MIKHKAARLSVRVWRSQLHSPVALDPSAAFCPVYYGACVPRAQGPGVDQGTGMTCIGAPCPTS